MSGSVGNGVERSMTGICLYFGTIKNCELATCSKF